MVAQIHQTEKPHGAFIIYITLNVLFYFKSFQLEWRFRSADTERMLSHWLPSIFLHHALQLSSNKLPINISVTLPFTVQLPM